MNRWGWYGQPERHNKADPTRVALVKELIDTLGTERFLDLQLERVRTQEIPDALVKHLSKAPVIYPAQAWSRKAA